MPSMITSERREVLLRVVQDSARKGGDEAITELTESGVLQEGNVQRVQAQGDKVAAVVKTALKILLAELAENIVGYLKRIFAEKSVEVAETDGKETLASVTDVFKGGIYGAVPRKKPGKRTKKILAAVYEMIKKDGKYRQIFGGFGENLRRLVWQESQIVAFCRDPRDLPRAAGYGTVFLLQGGDGG